MSYYVSAIDGSRKALLVGPFRTNGAALAQVETVRSIRHPSMRAYRTVCRIRDGQAPYRPRTRQIQRSRRATGYVVWLTRRN